VICLHCVNDNLRRFFGLLASFVVVVVFISESDIVNISFISLCLFIFFPCYVRSPILFAIPVFGDIQDIQYCNCNLKHRVCDVYVYVLLS